MEPTEVIEKFESVLKLQSNKKTLKLYTNDVNNISRCQVKPQDVIADLTSHLSALQKADNLKNNSTKTKDFLNNCRSSKFVSLNTLQTDEKKPSCLPSTRKFETQCVTDTQLLNLIEGAEMQIEQGMTQEFNTSFRNQDDDSSEQSSTECYNDVRITERNQNPLSDKDIQSTGDILNKNPFCVLIHKETSEIHNPDDQVIKTDELSLNENDEDLELPQSPVFKNSVVTQRLKTPLVYNLESFEKFESIAVPIVEENLDRKAATKAINSQIIDRVLFLNLHSEPLLLERDKQCSPVINVEDNLMFHTDIDNIKRITPDKRSDSLKDDLLFSSDEDEEYVHNLTPKLHLSNSLDTISDETDKFDISMYVSFQTASNKSIQVCTDSFQKARSFCDIELTERDSKSSNASSAKEEEITAEKRKYDGFITASNKRIKLSEKSFSRCRKVFQDIDLDESYTDINTKSQMGEETKEDNMLPSKIDDDDIIQELAQIEMSVNDLNRCSHENVKRKAIDNEVILNKRIENPLCLKDLAKANLKKEDYKVGDTYDNSLFHNLGFKTASSKEILISTKSIQESRVIFQDLVQPKDNVTVCKSDENTLENSKELLKNMDFPVNFTGFETTSSKELLESKETLKKYKRFLQDMDTLVNVKNFNVDCNNKSEDLSIDKTNLFEKEDNKGVMNNIYEQHCPDKFCGFKTANNKEVVISKDALERSKMVFKDLDFNQFIDETCRRQTDSINKYQDFRTDNNKQNEKIFETANFNITDNFKNCNDSKLHFQGFQTASNKTVQVSQTALEKSKKLLQELTNSFVEFKKIPLNDEPKSSNPFKGFQTACEKKVTISEKALAKTKDIFKDVDNYDFFDVEKSVDQMQIETANNKKESEFYEETEPSAKHQQLKGFRTASNKQVLISEAALAKTKTFFDDTNTIDKNTQFTGFQTANKKNVVVSAGAIAKSKKLFEDLVTSEISSKPANNNSCFQTAANKKIGISPQALAKTRHWLSSIDDNNCNKKSEVTDQAPGRISIKFGFNPRNRNARILKEALKEPEEILETDAGKQIPVVENEYFKTKNSDHLNDVENLLNTQVLNNFEESLCTEDFCKTPRLKRPGSPILSCPKAKRRKKFETPYKTEMKTDNIIVKTLIEFPNTLNFDPKYKKFKKYNLKDLTMLEDNSKSVNQKHSFQIFKEYNFETLLQFEFKEERNELSDVKLTTDDLNHIFMNAVDKKIIPKGWVENHMKLILWKLISYEIKFPNVMAGVCTARNVIDQLKFRYDKELHNAHRPALRKILEKDETSYKTMVLCVVAIYADSVKVNSVVSSSTVNLELLLTDGWYTIMATLDKMLSDLVLKEKIKVGSKLAICGAELLNCEQGIAPWENTSAVRLKLFGNSTRRARWDARLGFHGNHAILSQLSSVKLDGGKISKLRVFVTRVYPMLYVEKFEDGSTVTRSERLENLHQIKFENERQAVMEQIYEEVEKELSDQSESQDSDTSIARRNKMETGSQIAKVMKQCNDPAEFRASLTPLQIHLLQEYTSKRRDEHMQRIQTRVAEKVECLGASVNRRVTTLLRMRVTGVGGRGREGRKAMLSLWRPSCNMLEIIREGAWIDILNVVPTSIRYSELQMSAGRQSSLQESKYKPPEQVTLYTNTLKRRCYSISDLVQNLAANNDFDEIDTIGMVFLIEPPLKEFDCTKRSFQNVYVTDADKRFICINFWGGIKKSGYENLLEIGGIIACVNLQRRAGNTRKSIPQYRVTEFTYFTKTPKDSVARSMVDNLEKKILGLDKCKYLEDCVAMKNNYSVVRCYNNDNFSPYRLNNSDYNVSKHKQFIDSPLLTKTNKNEENLDLSGLDFESSFRQTNSEELSPNALLRRNKVKERINKLKRYGEPPPISPITILNKSKNATSAFRSPLLNPAKSVASISTEKPQTDYSEKQNDNEQLSPVITMNRTYVKRDINPVKLNFSNNVAINDDSGVIDQFAEEFETSPPLSLD